MLTTITTSSPRNISAWVFLCIFMLIARVLYDVPAETKTGPVTATGHVPTYLDNGIEHCICASTIFLGGSNFVWGLYDFGIIYDVFVPLIGALNVFGLLFCLLLYVKGLLYPSTKDSGSSGSVVLDYYWGTELYPQILGVDVKRFVNCRFSMTFWMLAGLSYAYRSYTVHGVIDYGLLFTAVSQYIYLVKFFAWESGYMASMDVTVDRAGFYEIWGCLVFVPSLYSLNSRVLVRSPSQLSFTTALLIFSISLFGVFINFWADKQREWCREANGKMKIWSKDPVFIEASYTVIEDGKHVTKKNLLLASGFWGAARHFHYIPELLAAWSWCLLANPLVNGVLPLSYAIFLTMLLFHRASRDEEKCLKKYGDDYKKYSDKVPYRIIPYIY
jgi:7-dehydrocholesterol reductase